MKRLISLGFSLTAFVLGTCLLAQAQVGLSWEVQAPELTAPSRGSLAGQLSAIAFGPPDVSRGGFNLASPYTAPVDRGPLLAKVFPGYSPETGISEWGLGWQADLALTRWRVRGGLDYQTDDLTGMFGHCQKSQKGDGYWYPVGLTPAVRLQEVPDGFVAYAPDGTIFRFGQSARVVTPSGTYQWLLREVENPIGQKTKLTYGEVNASGRLFLTRVEYGGRGEDFQYRIDISYSPLAQDFIDYRSNFPLHIDRRVSAVAVYAKSTATGQMALRWKYQPTYQPEPLGPAFFLSAVQQVFASGETAPAFTFQYQLATSTLQSTQLQPASKFERVIADFTSGIPFPDRSTAFDSDMSGMVDLETAFDYTLIRQTADDYVYEALPDPSGGERAECRAAPSNANRPRTLAQIRPSDQDYSVVSLQYRESTLDTELLLCGREGLAKFDATVPGDWTLGPTARLVDLNRDHQPDLIRVYEGGYQIIPNASTSKAYAFATPIQGNLDLHFPFEGFWVLDFNGDGIPDLVLRSDSLIAVYFGKGNFQFEPEPQFFPVENEVGQQFDLSNFQFTWLDANGDGLTDLLLSLPTSAYLFANTGSSLRQTPVPALSAADNISFPLFSDFVGSGNAEVFVLRANKPYSLALNAPGTSLLQSADDGRGTVLRFSYLRSPAVEGIHQRHSLLDTLTVETSGHDSVTYRYNYDAPVLHSIGQFLLGFGHVTRQGAALTETMDFFNNDTTTGLLLASNQHDDNSPQVDAFETRQYEDVNSFGVSWKRLRTLRSGWKKPGSAEMIFEQTDYPQYEAEVCPRLAVSNNANGTLVTEKTRASVSNLDQHLHCLESQIVQRGGHADKTYDFVYETHLDRNPTGLVTKIQSLAGNGALTLQEIFYNPDYTINHISSPGRGSTGFAFDPTTRLLQQVTTPDLTVIQAAERDAATDGIRTLRTDRGGMSFTQHFRYDGQERLAKVWNDLGGASEQVPNEALSYYFATAATPGAITATTLVDVPSKSFANSVQFATAANESFAAVRHIPEGWAFDSLTERNINNRENKSYLRPTITPEVDILHLTYPAFFSSAQQISSSRMSSFGYKAESRLKFHADVEKHVATSFDLANADLTETELENGLFRRVRHLDAEKHTLAFEDEAGARYGYRYDAMGRLREVRFPDGTRHHATYDGHGRIGQLDREGVASVQYTYDSTTGLMTKKLFLSPSGQPMRQVAFVYDAVGRKSLETHTDLTTNANQSFHYYYDGSKPENPSAQTARGLLTAVAGDGFVKRFDYRPDGSLSRRSVSIAGWRDVTKEFDYYEDGATKEKRTTLQDSLGQSISRTILHYDRDSYGRVSASSFNGTPLATLGYDDTGEPVQVTFASGDSIQLSRDPLTRRLVGMSESTAHWSASNSQRMNNRGLVGSETISLNALTLNRVYGYSPRGFLTGSTDEQTSYGYEFDSFGLPTSITKDADRRTLVDSGDTLTVANAAGSVVYRFDGLGRTVQKGDLSFAYGPSGRVAQVQRGADSWSFIYDETGLRLAKRSSEGFVAGYFDEGYVNSSGLTEPFQAGGLIVGVISSGTLRLLPIDLRGTVTGEIDGAARISSPFGDRVVHPEISAAIDYVTKGYDADLGVVFMGVRDYDPTISRFLTPDPLFLENPNKCLKSPVECNLYAYARNSPASFSDMTGLGADDVLTRDADFSSAPQTITGSPTGVSASSSNIQSAPAPWENLDSELQRLLNAQNDARNNNDFAPTENKNGGMTTHCNQATCAIAQEMGAAMGPLADRHGDAKLANTQAHDLAKSSDYKEVTPKEAQALANQGKLVIAAYENPKGHGHLASVRPEGVAGDTPPKGSKSPLLNNIGASVGVQGENYSFRKGMEVHYYTPQ